MEGSPDGNDLGGEGGAGPHRGHETLLPQGGSGLDAALRRRPAHRQRPDRGRGRPRLRRDGAALAAGHRRDLRARERGDRAPADRPPEGEPVRRPRGQGRRGAGPADRSARRSRPTRARAAATGGVRCDLRRDLGLAWCIPRPRLADRAWPVLGARGDLPRVRRPPSRWSARPAASASPPRLARCAASTAWSSATAT